MIIKQDCEDKTPFERMAYLIEKHASKIMAQGEYLSEKRLRSLNRKEDIKPKRVYVKRNT